MEIIKILLFFNIVIISAFVSYNAFFLIPYIFFKIRRKKNVVGDKKNVNEYAIIVPAHNEELIIGELIDSVKALNYPADKYELIIIADNCTDNTEKIIRDKGGQCYVRTDSIKKGKPYALEWIFRQIDLNKYDGFNIIDADTIVDKNYLKEMNNKMGSGSTAIQGYFGIMNPDQSWLTRLMVIPGILKFKIRYSCKDKMGLSCPLMGNGMCFSKKIIKNYGWDAFSITENWEYYVKLVLNDYTVSYAEDAIIYSHAVTELSHGETQRKRWFKGRLGVLKEYSRTLLCQGLKNRNIKLLDSLFETALPSYSMLFSWSIILVLVAGSINIFEEALDGFLVWGFLLVAVQCFYFLFGLIVARATIKTWIMLVFVPIFLLWKLIVTAKGIFGFRDRAWEKTERKL